VAGRGGLLPRNASRTPGRGHPVNPAELRHGKHCYNSSSRVENRHWGNELLVIPTVHIAGCWSPSHGGPPHMSGTLNGWNPFHLCTEAVSRRRECPLRPPERRRTTVQWRGTCHGVWGSGESEAKGMTDRREKPSCGFTAVWSRGRPSDD